MANESDDVVAEYTLTVRRPGFDWEDLDAEAVPLAVAEQAEAGMRAVVDMLTGKFGGTFEFSWREK